MTNPLQNPSKSVRLAAMAQNKTLSFHLQTFRKEKKHPPANKKIDTTETRKVAANPFKIRQPKEIYYERRSRYIGHLLQPKCRYQS